MKAFPVTRQESEALLDTTPFACWQHGEARQCSTDDHIFNVWNYTLTAKDPKQRGGSTIWGSSVWGLESRTTDFGSRPPSWGLLLGSTLQKASRRGESYGKYFSGESTFNDGNSLLTGAYSPANLSARRILREIFFWGIHF